MRCYWYTANTQKLQQKAFWHYSHCLFVDNHDGDGRSIIYAGVSFIENKQEGLLAELLAWEREDH